MFSYLSRLMFSELPESVFQCLTLIWEKFCSSKCYSLSLPSFSPLFGAGSMPYDFTSLPYLRRAVPFPVCPAFYLLLGCTGRILIFLYATPETRSL